MEHDLHRAPEITPILIGIPVAQSLVLYLIEYIFPIVIHNILIMTIHKA